MRARQLGLNGRRNQHLAVLIAKQDELFDGISDVMTDVSLTTIMSA